MAEIIDQGDGSALVFLHGAGVDNELWAPQLPIFSKNYRVLIPNLPGHGSIPSVENIELMADYVRTLLIERRIKKYAIVGLSLGGMIGIEISRRWPKEVSHLVLIESVPYVTKSRIFLRILKLFLTVIKYINPRILAMLPARSMGAETEDSAMYLKKAIGKMKAQNVATILQASLDYDGSPYLSGLPVPTLIMVGERNTATHKGAKLMSEAIQICQFKVIPNAGHIANRDAPELVNISIQSFLNSTP